MDEKRLLALKKEVDDAKSTVSEYKGHQTALMKQLKDDWQCDTIEQAEKKLATMKKDLELLTKDIEEGEKKLNEMIKF
jgi:septal ring factor EnvC (AmiA/AmiB activator)